VSKSTLKSREGGIPMNLGIPSGTSNNFNN